MQRYKTELVIKRVSINTYVTLEDYTNLYIKCFVIWAALMYTYVNHLHGHFISSLLLPWIKYSFAACAMHEAGHKVGHTFFITSVNWFCSCFGIAGTPRWIHKHNAHHVHTNSQNDPELNMVQRPIPLWKLVGLYSLLHVDVALDHLKFQPDNVRGVHIPPTPLWKNIVWISSFVMFQIVAPVYYQGFSMLFWDLIYGIPASLFISLVFQCSHLNEKTVVGATDDFSVSANFAPDNFVLTHLYGGLNYQIEHHIASYLPHTSLPRISAELKKELKKQEIFYVYNEFPTFWEAIESHVRYMTTQ